MNRKVVLLSTALIAAMMLSLSVAPAMAKPNVVTVVVTDSNGKPSTNVWVFLTQPAGPNAGLYFGELTDAHGKAVFADINAIFVIVEPKYVYIVSHDGAPAWGSFYLNRQFSGRIVVSPPS